MKAFIITEKELDQAFFRAERDYQYNHEFMEPHESDNEFKETKRGRMLEQFRRSLKDIKQNIKDA